MAVVQISRIQHRRGRKLAGSGVPQLASGELGWAIDSQELYIGNGAVSEGAPTVGNTKILTENDDLLTLAGQYAYKRGEIQTGISAGSPVERTIQAKLDDVVSVRDFGATGDGTDQTEKIQRAIDQLFLNSATKGLYSSKIKLIIPAGEYLLTTPLYIPPFANIEGDGKNKTYFVAQGEHAFYTKNGDGTPGTPADDSTNTSVNQPRNITLKGMTILHTSFGGALRLQDCKDSIFEDIEVIGQWSSGDGITDWTGIKLTSLSEAVYCDNNVFINCNYSNLVYPIFSDNNVSNCKWLNNDFKLSAYGAVFGLSHVPGAVGSQRGAEYNSIVNSTFTDIDKNALIIDNGRFNTSENNKFISVGNDGGSSATATHSIIRFAQESNLSVNDYFSRTADLTVNPLYNSGGYPPEVEGPKEYKNNFEVTTPMGVYLIQDRFMQLPADQNKGVIEVYYTYRAEIAASPVFRKGTLTVVYNKASPEVSLSDSFYHTGNPTKDNDLEFFANLVGDYVEINVVNTTPDAEGQEDEFRFTLKHIA